MGYRLNGLDEPVFMAGPKPMRTEFGIYHRLGSFKEFSLELFVCHLSKYQLHRNSRLLVGS